MSDQNETIQCRNCGDKTNHCPPGFPPEFDGYCPKCAVDGIEAGKLPMPSAAAILDYIATAIANRIMNGDAGVQVHVVTIGENGSPGDIIETPVGPIFYSKN